MIGFATYRHIWLLGFAGLALGVVGFAAKAQKKNPKTGCGCWVLLLEEVGFGFLKKALKKIPRIGYGLWILLGKLELEAP